MKEVQKCGQFCEIFGATPRNRIMEFFLEGREIDFSLGDVAKETGLNRATTYSLSNELINEGYLVASRKISGTQLYRLNLSKREVGLLIKAFNLVLGKVVDDAVGPMKRLKALS